MNAYQAQRIRFGILAARHTLERHRLTQWQADDVEGMELGGWKYRDAPKAFERESAAAQSRIFGRGCSARA
jgi:hypothetical protein